MKKKLLILPLVLALSIIHVSAQVTKPDLKNNTAVEVEQQQPESEIISNEMPQKSEKLSPKATADMEEFEKTRDAARAKQKAEDYKTSKAKYIDGRKKRAEYERAALKKEGEKMKKEK